MGFSVKGRSNQPTIFFDSTGRTYTIATHTLPSARSQGEPLTGRVNPPAGSTFEAALIDEDKAFYLVASDAGYGFVTTFADMVSRNKAGKTTLTLPKFTRVMTPVKVEDVENQLVVAISNEGRMLVFPLKDLPVMTRGKGNKLISIPAARASSREEYMVALSVLGEGQSLTVFAGKRHLTLKSVDLEHYRGERGRRGNKLPRGFQKVDGIEVNE